MSNQSDSLVNPPVPEQLKINDKSPSALETLTDYALLSPSAFKHTTQTQAMHHFPHADTVLPKELIAKASKVGVERLHAGEKT